MPWIRALSVAALTLWVGVGLPGCDPSSAGGGECNPLGGPTCLMPWPSMAYLTLDPSSGTGYRVDLPSAAMPVNVDGTAIDPAPFNRWDGFSPSGPMIAAFASGVSAAGLPPFSDPAQSMAADAPIVLLDLDTGERWPYFAEVDMNSPDLAHRSLIIRPLRRFPGKTHVGVAIRTAVKAADGGALLSPPVFQDLLAGRTVAHPRLHGQEARYTALFDTLAAKGVPRTDLVLAWDYVTASDEMLTSDLLTMRDAALPAIGHDGANLSFAATAHAGDPAKVHAFLEGTFTSPNFLTGNEEVSSVLRRGADGKPTLSGLRNANVAVVIPKCVEAQPGGVPVMVFGHGLFGSAANYLDDGFLQGVAQDFCFVIVAGDFIGLTERQINIAALSVNDLNKAGGISDKLAQSVIDFIALEQIVRGPMAAAPQFQVNGHSVVDPTQVYYLGGSLGGIMGLTFMSYDPHILRAGLGVPGGAWSLLFERSTAWTALQGAAIGAYEDPYHYQLLVALLGMRLEPYDPITTASHVIADPLPGTPVKQLDLYEAVGDCLVTNIATEMMARTMGLQIAGPSLKQPWGLDVVTTPLANALTIYDEHRAPLPPTTNIPPAADNGTHSHVNQRQAVLRQVHAFLLQGTITNTCTQGELVVPCDCATGACD